MELQLIHKKRKLFARVIQYSFLGSLVAIACILIFDLELKDNIIQKTIGTIVFITFGITVIYYIFISWFPIINEHSEIGVLTLDHYDLTRTIYDKQQLYKIEDLQEMKISISGYHGQDKSFLGKIRLADGTMNFITLNLKNQSSIKMEFMLENQRVYNTFMKYLDFYRTSTKVSIN